MEIQNLPFMRPKLTGNSILRNPLCRSQNDFVLTSSFNSNSMRIIDESQSHVNKSNPNMQKMIQKIYDRKSKQACKNDSFKLQPLKLSDIQAQRSKKEIIKSNKKSSRILTSSSFNPISSLYRSRLNDFNSQLNEQDSADSQMSSLLIEFNEEQPLPPSVQKSILTSQETKIAPVNYYNNLVKKLDSRKLQFKDEELNDQDKQARQKFLQHSSFFGKLPNKKSVSSLKQSQNIETIDQLDLILNNLILAINYIVNNTDTIYHAGQFIKNTTGFRPWLGQIIFRQDRVVRCNMTTQSVKQQIFKILAGNQSTLNQNNEDILLLMLDQDQKDSLVYFIKCLDDSIKQHSPQIIESNCHENYQSLKQLKTVENQYLQNQVQSQKFQKFYATKNLFQNNTKNDNLQDYSGQKYILNNIDKIQISLGKFELINPGSIIKSDHINNLSSKYYLKKFNV